MNYPELLKKRDLYQTGRLSIPKLTLQSFEQAFEIEYTHNSTAIEGNTLTLIETKVLLEDGISIGGKMLREIYEAVNHQKAFRHMKDCAATGKPLDECMIKEIHRQLMEHVRDSGVYRNTDVYLRGAGHTPPSPVEMGQQLQDFYEGLNQKDKEENTIELAAWTHAEFVKILPFTDGNGRAARLIMNYQLMANGFPAVSIAKENRLDYFNALEVYATEGNLVPFAEVVADLIDQQLDRYLGMMEPSEDIQQNPKM